MVPSWFILKQRIRYVRSSDDINLAWAEAGSGMPLVKAANWLTHLEYDWESPVWKHWNQFLSGHFQYVRYDERGCGMTDWRVGDLSFERWLDDLERVIDATALDQPVVLLGISQGAAIAAAYAARHPQRVSHLILYGGYAVGGHRRGDEEHFRAYQAMTELIRQGWDNKNPAFRQLFSSRFIPEGSNEQIDWFNELCRRTTSAQAGAALMDARGEVDVRDVLPEVRTPTLVMHGAWDQVVPISEGRQLARDIPDARFVQLDSCNHVLLEQEPAWQHFQQTVLDFTGQAGLQENGESACVQQLTQREQELLKLLCHGHSNAQMADILGIAEKTARNHLSNLYRKIDVHSRSAAIAFAFKNKLQPSGFPD